MTFFINFQSSSHVFVVQALFSLQQKNPATVSLSLTVTGNFSITANGIYKSSNSSSNWEASSMPASAASPYHFFASLTFRGMPSPLL